LITALLALIRPVMHFRATLEQLAKYTQSPWYGILLSGLLAVLVFSRLFGMQVLWHDILEHGYMRVVKNAVEEGSESFGYMLCLAASLGYYVT
ncbi:transporter, partial [Klebsiella aerogenes]|nr:transporter [Klebsiella aerogenes]